MLRLRRLLPVALIALAAVSLPGRRQPGHESGAAPIGFDAARTVRVDERGRDERAVLKFDMTYVHGSRVRRAARVLGKGRLRHTGPEGAACRIDLSLVREAPRAASRALSAADAPARLTIRRGGRSRCVSGRHRRVHADAGPRRASFRPARRGCRSTSPRLAALRGVDLGEIQSFAKGSDPRETLDYAAVDIRQAHTRRHRGRSRCLHDALLRRGRPAEGARASGEGVRPAGLPRPAPEHADRSRERPRRRMGRRATTSSADEAELRVHVARPVAAGQGSAGRWSSSTTASCVTVEAPPSVAMWSTPRAPRSRLSEAGTIGAWPTPRPSESRAISRAIWQSASSSRSVGATLIPPGGEVVCLVSGGADSTCLWHVLGALGYRVSAVHVDHGLRGAESDGRRRFCRERMDARGGRRARAAGGESERSRPASGPVRS